METERPELVLKAITELDGLNFIIPSYQRGYRWSEKQVEDLLNDLKEFSIKKKDDEFYCLQPLVVKSIEGSSSYRVVDGQQRLTTIYLLLSYLKNENSIYTLDYETRQGSKKYLNNINQEDAKKNIDYAHMWVAQMTIKEWYNDNSINFGEGEENLLKKVKFIWYSLGTDDVEIDVFTRLNAGKIPLSSAELIKALILNKKEFTNTEGRFEPVRQSQVGTEWDIIEKALQNDSLWYFITGGNNNYTSRIEYLFHLRHGDKTKSIDPLSTYLSVNQKVGDEYTTHKLWEDLKNDYMKICEWYEDHDLYHLLGYWFVINNEDNTRNEANTRQVKEMLDLHTTRTKEDFKNELKSMINKKNDFGDIKNINYEKCPRKKIIHILLLFNIVSVMRNESKEYRFPFDLFLKPGQEWDIEHVRSVTDYDNKVIDQSWIMNIKEYIKAVYGDQTTGEYLDFEREVGKIIDLKNEDDKLKRFNDLVRVTNSKLEVDHVFKDINSLGNLVLLDQSTNRSYKNLPFSVKRYIIFEKDSKVVYVPQCTRNVFAKQYTINPIGYSSWTQEDADSYLNHIIKTLQTILGSNPQ